MIECPELTGKVVRRCTIFEDGRDGPEIQIGFTDGTSFFASLKSNVCIEAKCFRDDDGQPQLFKDYSTPAAPR
jgi:hypothetical protein